jgi:DNA-binding protein YbaB
MSTSSQDASFLDPGGARLYLESVQEQVERTARNARTMREQLDQLRVRAADSNELARVTIDSSGVLVDLELTDRVRRVEPDVIARAVLSAVREARTKAVERSRQIAVEALGPDSMSARVFADRLEQQLQTPDPAGSGEDHGRGPGRG